MASLSAFKLYCFCIASGLILGAAVAIVIHEAYNYTKVEILHCPSELDHIMDLEPSSNMAWPTT